MFMACIYQETTEMGWVNDSTVSLQMTIQINTITLIKPTW